jgi:hypothetical protein
MKTSPGIGQLAAALSVARGKMRPIPKDKTARVPMKAGGSYSYNYADLSSILDIVTPELAAAGLAIMQPATANGSHVTVNTILAHSSGEWLSEELSLEAAGTRPQDIGAAYTYARRYAVIGVLSLAPDEDVDGEVEAEHVPRFAKIDHPPVRSQDQATAATAPPDAGEVSPFTGMGPEAPGAPAPTQAPVQAPPAATQAVPSDLPPKVMPAIRVRADRLVKSGACTAQGFLPWASKVLGWNVTGLSKLCINDLEKLEAAHRAPAQTAAAS